MKPRNPSVREQPALAFSALAQQHRKAQIITYATSLGTILLFVLFDPDHRLLRGVAHIATAAFQLIVK